MQIEFNKVYKLQGTVLSHFSYATSQPLTSYLQLVHVFEILTDEKIVIPCVAVKGGRGNLGFMLQDPGVASFTPEWDELRNFINVGEQLVMEGQFANEHNLYKPIPWKQKYFVFAPTQITYLTSDAKIQVDNSRLIDNSSLDSLSGMATGFHAARAGDLLLAFQYFSREMSFIDTSIVHLQNDVARNSRFLGFLDLSRVKIRELCSATAIQIAQRSGFTPDIPNNYSNGLDLLIEIGLSKMLFDYLCQNCLEATRDYYQYNPRKAHDLPYVRMELDEKISLARFFVVKNQDRNFFFCLSLDETIAELAIKSIQPSRNILKRYLGNALVSLTIKQYEMEKCLESLRAHHITTSVVRPRINTLLIKTMDAIKDINTVANVLASWGELTPALELLHYSLGITQNATWPQAKDELVTHLETITLLSRMKDVPYTANMLHEAIAISLYIDDYYHVFRGLLELTRFFLFAQENKLASLNYKILARLENYFIYTRDFECMYLDLAILQDKYVSADCAWLIRRMLKIPPSHG